MDPITTAGAFATIVGLLCNFKAERSGSDLSEFVTWLKEKHHEDVVASIQRDERLSKQLSLILAVNHNDLVDRLNRLDLVLSSVADHIEEFSGLAKAIHPQLLLSDQAVSIVKQLVSSGAEMFMERKIMTGAQDEYILIGGAVGKITYNEPRFIEDDLRTLIALGLLRLDHDSKGTRQFLVTRAAVALVSEVG